MKDSGIDLMKEFVAGRDAARFARWDAPKGWWYCDFDERLLPKPSTPPFEPSSRPPGGALLMRRSGSPAPEGGE